jgi:hypothetical protein
MPQETFLHHMTFTGIEVYIYGVGQEMTKRVLGADLVLAAESRETMQILSFRQPFGS